MATSSLGINGKYLIIQPPIEVWSLYPLLQLDSWGDGQHAPYTKIYAEVWFIVCFKPKIK